jgi:hypothetical protein
MYPAPSQYQPQTSEYRNEKQLYSETPKGMIGDNQPIQMREAPGYEENRFSAAFAAAHECPNCGGHLQEKMEKN